MAALKLEKLNIEKYIIPESFKVNKFIVNNLIDDSSVLSNYFNDNTDEYFKNKSLIDLELINNNGLKEELQYCIYILSNKNYKLEEFKRNIACINKYLIKFLIINNPDSLLNIDLKSKYETYLKDNDISLTEKGRYGYNEKMEKIQYSSTSRPFSILEKCQKILNDYLEQNIPEFDKDKWVLSKLNIKITDNLSRPIHSFSFEDIKKDKIKLAVKEIMFERLKISAAKSVKEILDHIKFFTKWLYDNHNEIESLDQLNRKIIEEYMGYLRTNKNITSRTTYYRLQSLKRFFDLCILYDIKNTSHKILMTEKDYHLKNKTMIKFYTDDEIKNINEHIGKLPIQYGRMFFIIENVGIRGSEICCLNSDCLSSNRNGDYYLKYFQIKTKQFNTIPINNIVAETIQAGLNESKSKWGENVKYVFAEGVDLPVKKDKFNRALNKWCYENNILDRTGNIMRIKLHNFRGTIATKYINLGVDLEIVRKLLGHTSKKAIYHYIEIHNDTVLKAMKPIIDIQEQMISNIGNIKEVQNDMLQNKEYIQLSNGMCCKPINEGVCKHANSCLTCKMFKFDKTYLPLYENQLREVVANIKIAKANNFERILEYNLELKNNLEKIIKAIKEN